MAYDKDKETLISFIVIFIAIALIVLPTKLPRHNKCLLRSTTLDLVVLGINPKSTAISKII
jgi:hypothetical protein